VKEELMDIKPVMSLFGFGHRRTRHIIIDREGELWLKLAPAPQGGFLPMGATPLPGTLRVEPLEDGKAEPFSYSASESLLKLVTDSGKTAEFTVDGDARALRIKGNAPIRLNGVSSASFVTTSKTETGVLISAGTTRYFIAAKKGSIVFDDTYILNKFRSVTPVLDVFPDEGEFELCAFDIAEDMPLPAITNTFEECASENGAEFKAFVDSLVDIPSEYGDVKERIAYPIWLCHRDLGRGAEVIVTNKYDSVMSGSRLMSIASMAFKDAKTAIGMLLAYPVELPPIAGIAAARLIEENMLCDSRGEIYKVYAALEAAASKCVKERTADREGFCFNAYRFESGLKRSPEFFKVGEPVITPDLNAYHVILCEVLGKLANMEYDMGAGKKWEARSKVLMSKVIAELWDGDDFIGKNAYTGDASKPDELLSLMPVILGKRLPREIILKLAAKINPQVTDSAMGLLLAGGLFDAGEEDAAKSIARTALEEVRDNGIGCPFHGASLLALAHKVLM